MTKNKTLTILLTASLVLNLAFLAALAYRRVFHPRVSARQEAPLKNDLQLSGTQKKQVHELARKFRINAIMFKEDILDKRVQIIEELGDPDCTPQKVNELSAELNQLENQLNGEFIATLLKINEILEPGQRLNMIYRLSRNWFFSKPGTEKGGPHE